MPVRCDKSSLDCSFYFSPKCFSLSSVQRFINEDKLPHLLFYGPPGTGKTSTILACARQLYKDKEFNSMVLEVRCSSSLAAACQAFPAPVQSSPWLDTKVGVSQLLFFSWMHQMTEVLMSCVVQFWVLPAPGPFSSNSTSWTSTLNNTHKRKPSNCSLLVLQEGLQVGYTGWGGCHDPGCPKCTAARWGHLFVQALPTENHTAQWAARQFNDCWPVYWEILLQRYVAQSFSISISNFYLTK